MEDPEIATDDDMTSDASNANSVNRHELVAKVSPNGEAYISWHLQTGSCLIVVDECEEDDDGKLTLVATGIYNLCLSPDSVSVMRSCYTITPRYSTTTTGGNISQVSSHGVLITNLCPGHHVRISLYSIQDLREVQSDVQHLRNENEALKKQVKDLSVKIEQIFYAPGMPGYLLAQEDFLEHCNR